METLRFVEFFVGPDICEMLGNKMQEITAEMKALVDNPLDPKRSSVHQLMKRSRKRRALLKRADKISSMESRLIVACEEMGPLNCIKNERFPCPFCQQEEYIAYMTRMDVWEKTGEVVVERGDEVEDTLAAERDDGTIITLKGIRFERERQEGMI